MCIRDSSSSNKASGAKAAEISDTENSVTELSTDTITAVSGKRMLPVSYTHLDVYKRQLFMSEIASEWPPPGF